MVYKKKKSIAVLFSFLIIFFIYCFCINLSSEGMKNNSKAISQIDSMEQAVIMKNENPNMENGYYDSAVGVEDKEEKKGSYTEQVAYLEDQNINDIFPVK